MVVLLFILLICFFKQKTAYEMRISDWSSDVCSSDLSGLVKNLELIPDELKRQHLSRVLRGWAYLTANTIYLVPLIAKHRRCRINGVLYDVRAPHHWSDADVARMLFLETPNTVSNLMRSEEHTSELQSLMRISYAVFCLKKKNK